jgi:hypothetical protein
LKKTNIDSLKELMQFVEKRTSYMEAFMSARHLENMRDWKSFITPHLLTGGDTLTGITFLPQFSKDAWGLVERHLCLISLPNTMEKLELAEVFGADERELRALDEFIAYKERCVERLQNIEKNLQAIDETRWLKQYLKEFPDGNREAQRALPFWPHEQERNVMEDLETEGVLHTEDHSRNTEVDLIMATMPDPKARGYFGPHRSRPSAVVVTRAPRKRASSTAQQTVRATSSEGGEDRFPPFNPENDI